MGGSDGWFMITVSDNDFRIRMLSYKSSTSLWFCFLDLVRELVENHLLFPGATQDSAPGGTPL